MVTHRLAALSVLAGMLVAASTAVAQGAFPAPLPNEAETCKSGYMLLREDAVEKSKLIKAASDRHAPSEEACKIIGDYSKDEVKMIEYVEAASTCGIQVQFTDQLKAVHRNTEAMLKKVCTLAEQARRTPPRGPIGDFDDIR
jgi:hypothetical protein